MEALWLKHAVIAIDFLLQSSERVNQCLRHQPAYCVKAAHEVYADSSTNEHD